MQQGGSILPSKYQAVEYVKGNDNEYFYLPSFNYANCDIEFKAQYFNSLSDVNAFGAIVGNDRLETGAGWRGNNFAVNYGASGLKVENMKADYNAHEYLYDKSGAYIDGVLATGSYYAGNANGWGVFTDSLRVRMFGTNRGNVIRTCAVAIYSWKCTKNGEELINLIPCYDKKTKEIGLLDVVSKIFYTNEGGGEFTKGNDIKL